MLRDDNLTERTKRRNEGQVGRLFTIINEYTPGKVKIKRKDKKKRKEQ